MATTIDKEQAAINSRKKIAEMMMQQGQQPLETNQVAGGYVVPVSPLAGVSKVAQQLAGAYMGKQAENDSAALSDKKIAEFSGIDLKAPDAIQKTMAAGYPEIAAQLIKNKTGRAAKENRLQPQNMTTMGADGKLHLVRYGSDPEFKPIVDDNELPNNLQYLDTGSGYTPVQTKGTIAGSAPQAQQPQTSVTISPDASAADRAGLEAIARQSGVMPAYELQQPIRKSLTPAQALQYSPQAQGAIASAEATAKGSAELPIKLQEVASKNQLEIEKAQNEKQAAMIYGAEQSTPLIDKAIELLPKTVSGGGNTAMNSAMEYLNISTDKSKAKAALDAIASELTSKVPRAPGAQSDIELKYAQQQAGNLADSKLPSETRMAAAMYLKDRNLRIMKGFSVEMPKDKANKKDGWAVEEIK